MAEVYEGVIDVPGKAPAYEILNDQRLARANRDVDAKIALFIPSKYDILKGLDDIFVKWLQDDVGAVDNKVYDFQV